MVEKIFLVFQSKIKIWYLLARTMKPNLIIESGIDKGLGSLLHYCYAQFKNGEEKPLDYKYIGVDITKSKNMPNFLF